MVASLKQILLPTGRAYIRGSEWLSCQTGEQFWQESFESVGVYILLYLLIDSFIHI